MAVPVESSQIPEENRRVLVLDDETSITEMISQHLSDDGYICTAFTSPAKALKHLEANPEHYALLITDLRMPEIHGMEVVTRARAMDGTLSIIVVTALLEVTSAIEALRAGADDYLLKPFNLSEISCAVEQVMKKRSLVLENRRYQRELEVRVREATADLARTNQELSRTKKYLEDLLKGAVDAIFTLDAEAQITYINEGARHMLGYSESDMTRQNAARFLAGGAQELRYLRRLLREEEHVQNYETELRHEDGHFVPVSMSISQIRTEEKKLVSAFAICKDITEQKRLENELKEMSVRDGLTGLYNQRYFYDRLEAEIERARRQGHPLSLLLFDIDQFKHYNDCHGHLEGDRVLKAVGELVMECTREHVDVPCRYGGDEFTAILPETDQVQALAIAERIRATFESKHFDKLTTSIGLMSYRGGSLRSFIRSTDAMMYDAKRSGGNRVYVYEYDDIDGDTEDTADANGEDSQDQKD